MSTDFGGTIPKQGEARAGKNREGGVAAPTISSTNKAKGE